MDNSFDFQVLQQYLRMYFNSELLNSQGPKRQLAQKVFSPWFLDLTFKIDLPKNSDYKEYVALINRLPAVDAPALFGLPPNIDRSLQRTNSIRIINQLKIMATLGDSGIRLTEWKEQLGPIANMWKQLIQEHKKTLFAPVENVEDTSKSPVDSFVLLELFSAKNLVALVDAGLTNILEFLAGHVLLSAEMQQMGTYLLRGQVPPQWDARWEVSTETNSVLIAISGSRKPHCLDETAC